ncbi:MAG: NAD(P)H:quinone oxidoreductase [Candidatus Aureabacteria bacterium]|nr:NAD(P)H:quinone oxidoreductase [Candidatus Auribacterota bacterium]
MAKPKIGIIYYSMFGNTYKMAKAVCGGVNEEGGEALLYTVPDLLPESVISSNESIKKAKEAQAKVKIAKAADTEELDGIILGSPTRFGNMCAQLRNFMDQTGAQWIKGSLINKPAGVFCCTASLHGGQETTLVSMAFTLIHHGAIIVGVPYSIKELVNTKTGGTPYGPTAVVGENADQSPTESDLKIAGELGKRVTFIAKKLSGL